MSAWGPTESEKQRLGVPGLRYRARKIRWARAPCTIRGQQETLYRIHGTNQPEYIGQAISLVLSASPTRKSSTRHRGSGACQTRPAPRSVALTSQYSFRHAAHRLSVAGFPLIFPVHSKRTLNRRPRLLRKNNSDPMQRPDDG